MKKSKKSMKSAQRIDLMAGAARQTGRQFARPYEDHRLQKRIPKVPAMSRKEEILKGIPNQRAMDRQMKEEGAEARQMIKKKTAPRKMEPMIKYKHGTADNLAQKKIRGPADVRQEAQKKRDTLKQLQDEQMSRSYNMEKLARGRSTPPNAPIVTSKRQPHELDPTSSRPKVIQKVGRSRAAFYTDQTPNQTRNQTPNYGYDDYGPMRDYPALSSPQTTKRKTVDQEPARKMAAALALQKQNAARTSGTYPGQPSNYQRDNYGGPGQGITSRNGPPRNPDVGKRLSRFQMPTKEQFDLSLLDPRTRRDAAKVVQYKQKPKPRPSR